MAIRRMSINEVTDRTFTEMDRTWQDILTDAAAGSGCEVNHQAVFGPVRHASTMRAMERAGLVTTTVRHEGALHTSNKPYTVAQATPLGRRILVAHKFGLEAGEPAEITGPAACTEAINGYGGVCQAPLNADGTCPGEKLHVTAMHRRERDDAIREALRQVRKAVEADRLADPDGEHELREPLGAARGALVATAIWAGMDVPTELRSY